MSRELGLTHDWPVIIAGVGSLGRALASYGGFGDHPASRRRPGRRRPQEGGQESIRASRCSRWTTCPPSSYSTRPPSASSPRGGGRPDRWPTAWSPPGSARPELRPGHRHPCRRACRCARSTWRWSCRILSYHQRRRATLDAPAAGRGIGLRPGPGPLTCRSTTPSTREPARSRAVAWSSAVVGWRTRSGLLECRRWWCVGGPTLGDDLAAMVAAAAASEGGDQLTWTNVPPASDLDGQMLVITATQLTRHEPRRVPRRRAGQGAGQQRRRSRQLHVHPCRRACARGCSSPSRRAAGPALATWLRRRFTSEFGPGYDRLDRRAGPCRETIRAEGGRPRASTGRSARLGNAGADPRGSPPKPRAPAGVSVVVVGLQPPHRPPDLPRADDRQRRTCPRPWATPARFDEIGEAVLLSTCKPHPRSCASSSASTSLPGHPDTLPDGLPAARRPSATTSAPTDDGRRPPLRRGRQARPPPCSARRDPRPGEVGGELARARGRRPVAQHALPPCASRGKGPAPRPASPPHHVGGAGRGGHGHRPPLAPAGKRIRARRRHMARGMVASLAALSESPPPSRPSCWSPTAPGARPELADVGRWPGRCTSTTCPP